MVDQAHDSIVAKATVAVPSDDGPMEAVSTIGSLPSWTRSERKLGPSQPVNSDSTLNSRALEAKTETDNSGTPRNNGGMCSYTFVSKAVIEPDSCVVCGRQIKFDKLSLTCRLSFGLSRRLGYVIFPAFLPCWEQE